MQFDFTQPMALNPDAVPHFIGLVTGKETISEERPTTKLYLEENPCLAIESADKSPKNLIAVVPIWGALTPDGYYGTSLDELPRLMRQLDANSQIGTIVLSVRSPGGTVVGTPEAADAVRAVRDNGQTRIVAIANGMMASAALWIGSAAEKLYVTPSGQIGSIGVISMYADMSQFYERMGFKVSVMRVPEKKARFSGIEPMTDDMRATMEQRIGESYDQFKKSVAANRGIRHDHVESKYGAGEMLSSSKALEAGLVDGVMTLDMLLYSLAKQPNKRAPATARAELAKAML